MNEDFKINIYFQEDGDEIENILIKYVSRLLNNKYENLKI